MEMMRVVADRRESLEGIVFEKLNQAGRRLTEQEVANAKPKPTPAAKAPDSKEVGGRSKAAHTEPH